MYTQTGTYSIARMYTHLLLHLPLGGKVLHNFFRKTDHDSRIPRVLASEPQVASTCSLGPLNFCGSPHFLFMGLAAGGLTDASVC